MKTKQIEIQDVLQLTRRKTNSSLFVEGGQTVHASFLQTKYFNEIVTYISPKLIGGKMPLLYLAQWFFNITRCTFLEIQEMKQIGDDIKIVAHARPK